MSKVQKSDPNFKCNELSLETCKTDYLFYVYTRSAQTVFLQLSDVKFGLGFASHDKNYIQILIKCD